MNFCTKMVSIFTTTHCTLNCKYCGSAMPKFREAGISYVADPQQVKRCIDELFRVYDYIDHLDFTGGEPLLWNGLAESLAYASQYRRKFGFLRVLTNGTLIPSKDLLSAIGPIRSKFDFFIDNYGALSNHVTQIKSILDRYDISYREIVYVGEDQDFGGWIDFGDLSYRAYSDQELNMIYENCLQAHHMCLTVFDGYLHNCTVAPVGMALGKIPAEGKNTSIPLLDHSIALEEKRKIAERFGEQVLRACRYCNGFDSRNAPRFPAAEQA
ncbi:MAG: 4Fe-4S cluster-binding domain-containing protein [Eubacteriales bacterium]|nr:4Fe-4S cluster-binding domain-containing protein [Christensenellaceae bacterium]MEA5066921.1 4Fe-4S cluster-binding domain-containing protein [Eubacteriales bacterium]